MTKYFLESKDYSISRWQLFFKVNDGVDDEVDVQIKSNIIHVCTQLIL